MIEPQSLDLSALPWLPLNARAAFPRQPAIYFAIDSQDQIQYIGISLDPRQRWQQHHRYGQLEAMGQVRIAYLFVDDAALLKPIESALIAWFAPPLNVVGRVEAMVSPDRMGEIPMSRVAVLRKEAGLTQRQLADLVGVTESTIRNLENNRNGVDQIERVVKLCQALNCSAVDLIEYRSVEDGEAGCE